MPKRCDNCLNFKPTIFEQKTLTDRDCWVGYCINPMESGRYVIKNMYLACEKGFEEGDPWKDVNMKTLRSHRYDNKI